MGCACAKASSAVQDRDSQESTKMRLASLSRRTSDSRVNSSRRHEGVLRYHGGEVKAMRFDKKANASMRVYDDQIEKRRREKSEASVMEHSFVGRVPKATQGEQVAAGWPAWLSNAAGEAITGWLPRSATTFEKLEKVCSML